MGQSIISKKFILVIMKNATINCHIFFCSDSKIIQSCKSPFEQTAKTVRVARNFRSKSLMQARYISSHLTKFPQPYKQQLARDGFHCTMASLPTFQYHNKAVAQTNTKTYKPLTRRQSPNHV